MIQTRPHNMPAVCNVAGTPTLAKTLNFISEVTATALLDGQLFVAVSNQVFVYNTTNFTLTRKIESTSFGSTLYGLAASAATNYLYISDYQNSKVYGVDLSVTNPISAPFKLCYNVNNLRGLSMTADGNVLVVTDDGLIREYTPNGTIVRQISFYTNIYHAMELSNSVWVVSKQASSSHQIFTTFTNGTVMKTFGLTAGNSLTQLKDPCSLVVEAHGYILVADYSNGRILVVNPSLSEARQLSLPVIQSLRALSLDNSRGQLYVGGASDGHYRVHVFNNVTNVNALFN